MTAFRRAGLLSSFGAASWILLGSCVPADAAWPVRRTRPTTGQTAPPQYQGQAPRQYFPSRDPRAAGRTPYASTAPTRIDPYLQSTGYQTPTSTTGASGTVAATYTAPREVGYEVYYDNDVVPVSTVENEYTTQHVSATAPPTTPHPAEAVVHEGPYVGQPCTTCVTSGPTLCDPNGYDKGCDRQQCPCPSEEALSYYRCNFWGHYPTFWRSWPDGFQRYRPELQSATIHDRFRKGEPGRMQAGVPGGDSDLDQQLRNLIREQQSAPRTDQPPPSSTQPGIPRAEPELLPEDALREQAVPPAAPQAGPRDNSGRWGPSPRTHVQDAPAFPPAYTPDAR